MSPWCFGNSKYIVSSTVMAEGHNICKLTKRLLVNGDQYDFLWLPVTRNYIDHRWLIASLSLQKLWPSAMTVDDTIYLLIHGDPFIRIKSITRGPVIGKFLKIIWIKYISFHFCWYKFLLVCGAPSIPCYHFGTKKKTTIYKRASLLILIMTDLLTNLY